jgi:hypothetical protein
MTSTQAAFVTIESPAFDSRDERPCGLEYAQAMNDTAQRPLKRNGVGLFYCSNLHAANDDKLRRKFGKETSDLFDVPPLMANTLYVAPILYMKLTTHVLKTSKARVPSARSMCDWRTPSTGPCTTASHRNLLPVKSKHGSSYIEEVTIVGDQWSSLGRSSNFVALRRNQNGKLNRMVFEGSYWGGMDGFSAGVFEYSKNGISSYIAVLANNFVASYGALSASTGLLILGKQLKKAAEGDPDVDRFVDYDLARSKSQCVDQNNVWASAMREQPFSGYLNRMVQAWSLIKTKMPEELSSMTAKEYEAMMLSLTCEQIMDGLATINDEYDLCDGIDPGAMVGMPVVSDFTRAEFMSAVCRRSCNKCNSAGGAVEAVEADLPRPTFDIAFDKDYFRAPGKATEADPAASLRNGTSHMMLPFVAAVVAVLSAAAVAITLRTLRRRSGYQHVVHHNPSSLASLETTNLPALRNAPIEYRALQI